MKVTIGLERMNIQVEGTIVVQMDETPEATKNSNGEAQEAVKDNVGENQETTKSNDTNAEAGGTTESTKSNQAVDEEAAEGEEKVEAADDKVSDEAEGNKAAGAGRYNEREMTREEELMLLRKHVQDIKDALKQAKDAEAVDTALRSLDGLLKDIEHDPVLGTYYRNLSGAVHALRLHDTTRSDVDRALQVLLNAIDEAVAKEKDKERVKKLEQFLRGMADNAEVIYEAIKRNGNGDWLNKIF